MDNLDLMQTVLRNVDGDYLVKFYGKEYVNNFKAKYDLIDKITENLNQEEMQILFSLVFNEGFEFRRLVEYFLGTVVRNNI